MSDDEQALLPFDDGSRIIRRQWHKGRWFFSIIDVIVALTDSDAPRQYWQDTKRRMAGEGWNETQEKILQLKMVATDGKMRLTDCADAETMLRIVQSIPSPKAEPIKQWLAQVATQKLEETAAVLSKDQWRLLLRGEVADKNQLLPETAQQSSVISRRDFAIFTDCGYKGLYNGETAKDIAARKKLGARQHILDHMEGTELSANLFRISLTTDKLQREPVETKGEANATAYGAGSVVRKAIADFGGTMPEDLPTPDRSIQEVERDERLRLEQGARERMQPSLFAPPETGEE
jgi:DNA-damage-inducible protein D